MAYSPSGSLVPDPISGSSQTDDNQGHAITNEIMDGSGDGQVYTLDEALTKVGFGKFQALVLVYAGLGTMAEAMEVMILSFIGPAVRSEWGLSSGQESLITTVVFAGMLIGAYSWGLISDNCGRRQEKLEFLRFRFMIYFVCALHKLLLWCLVA
ncbi:hypothetical protein F511_30886 [Dorcoceras hygrometricum]|uniref:Major facilitator superfamily (MFS) profile domain-containing protein n=1 Tax=Dorcoceras hygrometricum TaxID=472368 RepID=A0A2Z7ACF1_9LAMI|nr:hypothetical protein F511_30886 [Dorcoceras hygrometricum]